MSSNQLNEDFNGSQMCTDCRNWLNSFLDNLPFFVKWVMFLTLIFFIINFFTPYVAFYLANIPYFTLFQGQIWRLFTTAFITTGLINCIFSLFLFYRYSLNSEKEIGTVKYMLIFFRNCFFIQIIYTIIVLIISLIIRNTMLLKMKLTMGGVRNDGLWPIIMCEITLFCLTNPERDMRFFFFPCVFKAKYYPFILFGVFTLLSNFNINFELLSAIVFAFLGHYFIKNKIDISNQFAIKVENSFFCKWMKNKKGFVSITKTGSPAIPTNLENITNSNNNSNNNESNFQAFKGKGVTVGSDDNITRENIDYSNLASRNHEDMNSTDSRLDLNTTTESQV
jgi:membrane associated rhomboid family serine protease